MCTEILYDDDIVLMSETIEELRNTFLKCKETFEIRCLKVNLGNAMIMASVGITKKGISKSKVNPCGVCSLRVKANSVLFVHCNKWIHGRCAGVKEVTPKF